MGSRATWHLCGLSGLSETSNENILCPTTNPNQWDLCMVRIPWNTCIYEDFPHKETLSPPRKPRSVLHYYKNPKPQETKVRIIYPSSGILELWEFSNLTFGGSLAGTTPVLFTGSSLFLFRRFCLERRRNVLLTEDFWHHQLVPSVGNSRLDQNPYYRFREKELHGTYSPDGNQQ